MQRRQERRQHDGLHRRRRADDGHPHGRTRPRRVALPHAGTRPRRQRLEDMLYRRSGLLGVSGLSADMRRCWQSASTRGGRRSTLFVYRIVRDRLDGGRAGRRRCHCVHRRHRREATLRRVLECRRAAWLGLELDDALNRQARGRISAPGSRISAWALPTDEERMIARYTSQAAGARMIDLSLAVLARRQRLRVRRRADPRLHRLRVRHLGDAAAGAAVPAGGDRAGDPHPRGAGRVADLSAHPRPCRLEAADPDLHRRAGRHPDRHPGARPADEQRHAPASSASRSCWRRRCWSPASASRQGRRAGCAAGSASSPASVPARPGFRDRR